MKQLLERNKITDQTKTMPNHNYKFLDADNLRNHMLPSMFISDNLPEHY